MKIKRRLISHPIIAALLILSAAICTVGQSGTGKKKNKSKVEAQPQASPPAEPQTSPSNSPSLPAKHNTREAVPGQEGAVESQIASPSTAGASSSSLKSDADATLYSFEFTQPEFLINHIVIEHDASGRGKVTFERKNDDPIVDPIELSPAATARIKALWDALRFLDSDRSYQSDKQYPHLGTNRLRMKQGARHRLAEFNWTGDRDAFALVNEYKHAANQAIFIFDITLSRENQPLEAPKLMTRLDDYLRRNELSDAQQLVPLLRELSIDERIPLIARNHAARLLKKIEK